MTEGEPVVFVVDDDHALCELVISMLSRTGFKVVAAFDGPTGIETARDAHPAVILLDMMMPGLDGIGTCERLKQDPVLADIPVVGMTASLSAEARVIWHDPQPVSGNRFRHGVHLTRFGHDIDSCSIDVSSTTSRRAKKRNCNGYQYGLRSWTRGTIWGDR